MTKLCADYCVLH